MAVFNAGFGIKSLGQYMCSPTSLSPRSSAIIPRTQVIQSKLTRLASRYVANTFANRWLSVSSWIDWSAGRPIPGDDGDKFMPGGYKMRDLGPRSMSGHGHEEATKDEVNIYKAMVPNATIDAIVN